MKPSPISMDKVEQQIRSGVQKNYDVCCTECRVAFRWMVEHGQVVFVDGKPKMKETTVH